MKVCITSGGDTLESQVDPRFGRCAFFIVVDTETMEFEVVENRNVQAMGGAGMSNTWMQIISDIMDSEIKVVKNSHEAGAAGAALTTAVGLGIYPHLKVADDFVEISKSYVPESDRTKKVYDRLYDEYRALYASLSPIYRRIHNIDTGS